MESQSRLSQLNERYGRLAYLDRMKLLFDEFAEQDILVTTSFGSSSVVLLHMLNKVKPRHPVYLINTGYLFKETLEYKEQLISQFGLNVVDVEPEASSHQFSAKHRLWEGNPDFCCFINKVEPMNALKKHKKVWISGLLRFQNANRAGKQVFEKSNDGELLKFYPIIDMTQEELNLYQTIYELPAHPLLGAGYESIGCVHCTKKGTGRSGRWEGKAKTECGLHL